MVDAGSTAPTLWHEALFYRTPEDYLDGTLPFIDAAARAGEPVLVMVPPDNGELLDAALASRNGQAGKVRILDMTQLGRNPARIIPAQAQFFAAQHGPARIIGEPASSGRDSAALAECFWHEALINVAFADTAAQILCPYDVVALPDDVISDAWRSHPVVTAEIGVTRPSTAYGDRVGAELQPALLPAPADAEVLGVGDGSDVPLATLRATLRQRAEASGLPVWRADDLILAASEALTNSIRYSAAPATVRIWHDAGALVCEVTDSGHISDLLVGRRAPGTEAEGQRGLWLINQVCDLVQLRCSDAGTTLRMQVGLS